MMLEKPDYEDDKDDEIDEIDDDLRIEKDDEPEQIYPLSNIKVNKSYYTVFELKRKRDADEPRVILDSDFQREVVWNGRRKSELIESVLMGLPLPVFYLNQDKFGRLIVVDGRQRLTALFDYLDNKYELRGLTILTDKNGKKFKQLDPLSASTIEDYQIQSNIIIPPTPERIKYDIFDRVNRGGVTLNKQEIRNALHQGKSTKLLNILVKSKPFGRATGDVFKYDGRMKGRYLLTRYLAMHLFISDRLTGDNGKPYTYKGDMEDFLGRSMDEINKESDEEVSSLGKITERTLIKVFDYLGEDAFRFNRNGKRSPFNMTLFETIMTAFEGIRDDLPGNDVKKLAHDLTDSGEFQKNIENHRDGAANLMWRINEALKLRKNINEL